MNELLNKLILFISCLLVVLQATAAGEKNAAIVRGFPTTIKRAPFVVQVLENSFFCCGGTLISEKFVISAAHCFEIGDARNYSVVGGASNISNKSGVLSMVTKIHIPSSYTNATYHNDVAVLELQTALKGPSIQPIDLCIREAVDGDPMQIYGWGTIYEDGEISMRLRTTTVNVVDRRSCAAIYFNRIYISDTMICGIRRGRDACEGDSGGPAIVNGQFCGIVSNGIGCAREDSPGVYTDVIAVTPFIKSVTQPKNKTVTSK